MRYFLFFLGAPWLLWIKPVEDVAQHDDESCSSRLLPIRHPVLFYVAQTLQQTRRTWRLLRCAKRVHSQRGLLLPHDVRLVAPDLPVPIFRTRVEMASSTVCPLRRPSDVAPYCTRQYINERWRLFCSLRIYTHPSFFLYFVFLPCYPFKTKKREKKHVNALYGRYESATMRVRLDMVAHASPHVIQGGA